MIVDDGGNYWIHIVPKNNEAVKDRSRVDAQKKLAKDPEYRDHFGKWLVFAKWKYLNTLAKRLDPHINCGEIPYAKYSRDVYGLHSGSDVMCVYCDDRKRERVFKILQQYGVTRKVWKYDRQTIEDWQPGGRLRLASMRALEKLRGEPSPKPPRKSNKKSHKKATLSPLKKLRRKKQ